MIHAARVSQSGRGCCANAGSRQTPLVEELVWLSVSLSKVTSWRGEMSPLIREGGLSGECKLSFQRRTNGCYFTEPGLEEPAGELKRVRIITLLAVETITSVLDGRSNDSRSETGLELDGICIGVSLENNDYNVYAFEELTSSERLGGVDSAPTHLLGSHFVKKFTVA
ncbi:hypothetical protein R1flu_004034 [Riccia fluitans]|uniref:Uncharacterized protein n=1 Tax=Riccia fluitans TaxID=41844 RepID=A0ABD1YP58_9MARC